MHTKNKVYDDPKEITHNRIFFRLFLVGNTLDRKSMKELGVSPIQWAVLGALSRQQAEQGLSFSDLTDYLGVSRQNLDTVLKRLERDQHVLRISDKRDRRARKVLLTATGKVFWEELQPKIYEFYRQTFVNLNDEEQTDLMFALRQLNEGMKNVLLSPPAQS